MSTPTVALVLPSYCKGNVGKAFLIWPTVELLCDLKRMLQCNIEFELPGRTGTCAFSFICCYQRSVKYFRGPLLYFS